MQFSVCIDSVFKGLDQETALEKVKAAGFSAYEFWGWWDRNIDALAKKAEVLGLSCAAFCTRFVPLTDPGQRGAYLEGLKESIKAARKLGAKVLISQVGSDTGAVRAFQHKSVVAGLRAAAPLLEGSGVTLAIEPLNGRVDHIGTYLEFSDEGFEILEEAGAGPSGGNSSGIPVEPSGSLTAGISDYRNNGIKLLFDIYHQQITEGDIIRRFSGHIPQIAHIHSAGTPGRHELDTGELNYREILKALDAAGYQGYVGLEYFPQGNAEAGLKRMRDYLS
ncbi:hydroxypyruvate isomerase [Spirochaetia bacterium]|nr:hydroxypyruvate isomerase [Spirochaetia bacterium]